MDGRCRRSIVPRTHIMDDLDSEIEIFRKEEEEAQQYLFAYLSVRALLAERPTC